MRIGELSEQTGISQRMLRYYEQKGLLKPERSSSGYRTYNEYSTALVRHIRNLSKVGIKLKTIKILLPCISGEETSPQFVGCPRVKAILQSELEKLNEQLMGLGNSRDAVAGFLDNLISNQDQDPKLSSCFIK
ncbi:MerR family transcriptional regulator [Psychrobacter sp. B38]|uniref:MerR family transcriptional regulator n=1 Tax=Psychrobacter sp. B38 TaxID=3143538 RepID=UPI00320C7A4B